MYKNKERKKEHDVSRIYHIEIKNIFLLKVSFVCVWGGGEGGGDFSLWRMLVTTLLSDGSLLAQDQRDRDSEARASSCAREQLISIPLHAPFVWSATRGRSLGGYEVGGLFLFDHLIISLLDFSQKGLDSEVTSVLHVL